MVGDGGGGGGGGGVDTDREIFCTPPCDVSTVIEYSTVIDSGGSASLPSN